MSPMTCFGQKELSEALAIIQREDPSVVVTVNPETGQTLLSGTWMFCIVFCRVMHA